MDENVNENHEELNAQQNQERIQQEKQAVQQRYDAELDRHLSAVAGVNNAQKRNNADDSDEMRAVKEQTRRVVLAMDEEISDNYEGFRKQVLDLSDEFGRLITACQTYLSRKKMAKYRFFTRGRRRYKKVEALLALVKKERVQLRDLEKNRELFELRDEGALVGTALIYAVRDHAAFDANVDMADDGWIFKDNIRTKKQNGTKYTMSQRSGSKPEFVKNTATAGRVLDYMGLSTYGNKPSLVLARRNNSVFYGVKENDLGDMRSMSQIELEAGGAPNITYEPNALKQISNIKMLRMLLGIERFDAKKDIAFSYEKVDVNGTPVYRIKSAKLQNFSNAFSKNMTSKTLQR